MKKQLEKGRILFKMNYTGLISNTLGGLYQATYIDTDGKTKIAAVTNMEPTDARRMVPCLDEPSFKANWTVTVIHPNGTTAISNGIETEEERDPSGRWIVSRFKTTPPMSSYLLALIVSEFEFNEGKTESGVRFRIWSRPEAKNMTQYALGAGVKCLESYEKFFNIKFPLEKQDMVAVPDFSLGAMENWGLIIY
ncbi:peptidase family M1, partial [Ostertagia ostertagi]